MYFNPSGSNNQNMVYRMNRKTGADNTIYSLADKANDCNSALDRFFYLAMMAEGTFQFDDSNYTDLPIGVTNLVSGQQDYSLATDVMEIQKVLCKDNAGNWKELVPTDFKNSQYDVQAQNIITLPSNNGGIPTKYDKSWNSIFLEPIPNYSSANGFKVIFGRGPSYFIDSDTTKQPGLPIIFHDYIWTYGARIFLIDKDLTKKVAEADKQIQVMEDAIIDYFAHRAKDEETKFGTVYRSPR